MLLDAPQLFLLIFFIVLPVLLCVYLFSKKPTSLWAGAVTTYLLGVLTTLLIFGAESISPTLAFSLILPIIILVVLLSVFGIYAMIIALFWNEKILLKYEKKSFANFLPLIVGTALLVVALTDLIVSKFYHNTWIASPFSFILGVASYFSLVFFFYSITAILYNLIPIRGLVDYIIILGAGLNKDKVTPLLAARIEVGIKLYQKQKQKQQHTPTIIVSGGQGSDELISEAAAMAQYINDKHPDVAPILIEDKSTTTRENLLFSEQVALENGASNSFKDSNIVLATNNYHLLRAGKIASMLGINAQGVGARTRLFYIPTAFIREYIGYLVLSKKKHIIVIFLIFFGTIGLDLLGVLLNYLVK